MTSPNSPALILASSSPYRRALLERLALPFEICVPDIDETPLTGELAPDCAVRLAECKAKAVAERLVLEPNKGMLIIAADQVATCGTRWLAKPDQDRHLRMEQIQTMCKQPTQFFSGLCVLNSSDGSLQKAVVTTTVQLRHNLSEDELQAYLALESAPDVLGGVKFEGRGIALLEHYHSEDPTALIGLPMVTLTTMLKAAGLPL